MRPLLVAEGADVLVRQRGEQPGPLPVVGVPAQHAPCPSRRRERVLDQVGRQFPVTAGSHARMPEQPLVMSREEISELGDVAFRDPDLTAVIHASLHTQLSRTATAKPLGRYGLGGPAAPGTARWSARVPSGSGGG